MTKYVIWVHGTFDSPSRLEQNSNFITMNGIKHGYFGSQGDSHQDTFTLDDFSKSGYSQPNTSSDHSREETLKKLMWPDAIKTGEDIICFGYVWNGHADEASRVMGGQILSAAITLKGIAGEDLAVAGHSHGGNVIGHALDFQENLRFAKTYLFATPFFGTWGRGVWRSNVKLTDRGGSCVSFVHAMDRIQTRGASVVGGALAYSSCDGFSEYFIEPIHSARMAGAVVNGITSHTSMSSSEAFRMAADALGHNDFSF